MAEARGLRQSVYIGSDVLYDFACTPCSYSNLNEEAEHYCLECREYFCGRCFQDHNKFALMRLHKILDKTGMAAKGQQHTQMLITEKCQVHQGNTIDTYCPVHNIVGCGTCIALDHGTCKGIAYIPAVAKGFKKSQEFKNIKPNIQSTLDQLKTFKNTVEEDLKKLSKEKHAALAEITDYRKSIQLELEKMEKQIIDEVHVKYEILQSEINANLKFIEETMSTLESNLKKLKSTKEGNDADIFIYAKGGHSDISASDILLQNLNDILKRETLKFKKDNSIGEYIKHENLGKLEEERSLNSPKKSNKKQTDTPRKGINHSWIPSAGKYNINMKKDQKKDSNTYPSYSEAKIDTFF